MQGFLEERVRVSMLTLVAIAVGFTAFGSILGMGLLAHP